MLNPHHKLPKHVFFFLSKELIFCCICNFWCFYCTWQANGRQLRPELSGAVNSSPLNDQYEYNAQRGQIHWLPAEAHTLNLTEAVRFSAPLLICQAFERHLSILVSFSGSSLFVSSSSWWNVCWGSCFLYSFAWLLAFYISASLSFVLHCLVW